MTQRVTTSSDKTAPKAKKGILHETFSTLIWAVFLAYLLRTFLFQPFHIPSASMEPGLLEGDYIITTKYSLGYGKYSALPVPLPIDEGRWLSRAPKRGDVVVFRNAKGDGNVVKRIIGFPADEIRMVAGQLYINATSIPTQPIGETTSLDVYGNPAQIDMMREALDSGASYLTYDSVKGDRYDDIETVTVPKGHYFVLGDNRDQSADSRIQTISGGVGMLPEDNLMGRAEFVLLSVSAEFAILKPWTWGKVRKDRFFKDIQ